MKLDADRRRRRDSEEAVCGFPNLHPAVNEAEGGDSCRVWEGTRATRRLTYQTDLCRRLKPGEHFYYHHRAKPLTTKLDHKSAR